MSLFVIPHWFTSILFVALAALALWKGGRSERAIAVTEAFETLVNYYVCPNLNCRLGPHAFWATQLIWRPVIEDGVILAICLVCLVRAKRYWVVWACSFAVLGVLSDLTVFQTDVTRWARLSASLVWSYAVNATVLWALLTQPVAADGWRPSPSA